MGTKRNPGAFDCYANADPDEPMFVLLGRDPNGPILVRLWALFRGLNGEDAEKVKEARRCATAMGRWLRKLGKKPALIQNRDLVTVLRFLLDEVGG